MTTDEVWQRKTDEELFAAAQRLEEYTADGQAVIRRELERRKSSDYVREQRELDASHAEEELTRVQHQRTADWNSAKESRLLSGVLAGVFAAVVVLSLAAGISVGATLTLAVIWFGGRAFLAHQKMNRLGMTESRPPVESTPHAMTNPVLETAVVTAGRGVIALLPAERFSMVRRTTWEIRLTADSLALVDDKGNDQYSIPRTKAPDAVKFGGALYGSNVLIKDVSVDHKLSLVPSDLQTLRNWLIR